MPKRKRCATPAIGGAVEVYWPQDKCYYRGRVHHFNKFTHKFCVLYDDGDVEYLNFEDEQWRFLSSKKKKKCRIAHATATKRGRTTAQKPDEKEILLEEAHQVVLKVMRKSIRRLGENEGTITPWLVIRTAENILCSALTNPSLALGTGPVYELDHERSLVIVELKETISRASKNVTPSSVEKRENKDETRAIRTSLLLIFAARALLKHRNTVNK